MIDFTCPTNEEIDLLKQHYRKSQGTVSQRAHAVLLFSSGRSAYDISRIIFDSEKTVREWIKLWQKERIASIFSKNHCNQNAAKLTREQREEIAKVLSSPPSEQGLSKSFWDVSTLRNYMAVHFGVVYESPRSYHFLFKISSFSFKLPGRFDIRRNDSEVEKRLEEIRKIIKPFFKDSSWAILTGDESRLVWEAIVRRCWLPKGEKSILKVSRENIAQNLSGFLDIKTGRPHLFTTSWQNQKETIRVLKLLGKRYTGKKICLVWDNAMWHRGKLVREKLKSELNQFYLLAFPPYAPDVNPQEHVWKWSKDQIANIQFNSLEELTRTFRKIVTGRIYPYQI